MKWRSMKWVTLRTLRFTNDDEDDPQSWSVKVQLGTLETADREIIESLIGDYGDDDLTAAVLVVRVFVLRTDNDESDSGLNVFEADGYFTSREAALEAANDWMALVTAS